ncbi:DUF475 domain-containing protein [Gordonia sp. PDNC005]|uniref:DUF475 domain-containing protein n=1 Tax=Gordonia sp. PDNC005 TaxID=2811424 RepID=UPI001966994B|nr:DUF475 domain-containing protein [Gordonia sp. PDNC005]QRY64165.1 DUF475 domain-containing protein [Gordonia sp. PDNC005]
MTTFRIFGASIAVTVVALIVAFLYGGWAGVAVAGILGILEISLSFDNAVINATVLERMSPIWQRIFLTIGVLIAVFGMRLVFPLAIVWATSGLNPVDAMDLALNPPADGASHFPGGSASYETLLTDAHPQIAAFGGMFLLMLFLDFLFDDSGITWLSPIEDPLTKVGRLPNASTILALGALVIAAQFAESGHLVGVLTAGVLGLFTYLLVNGLTGLIDQGDPDDGSVGATEVVKAVGKAGFFLFLYLEVLDASFSFDGVIGAFAITSDPILIALGLGFIGAMFVRSITVYLVRAGTLSEYRYLEHGAHWAIGALAVIMLVSIHVEVPELVTGLIGVAFIGASAVSSIVANRRDAARTDDTDDLATVESRS